MTINLGDLQLKNYHDYMHIKEAAEYLGVTPNTLRTWEREGKIVVFRDPMSNYRMYQREDLEKILQDIKPWSENG
jgi:MerR family copper efflux transcriptional regulator